MMDLPLLRDVIELGDGRTLVVVADADGLRETSIVFGRTIGPHSRPATHARRRLLWLRERAAQETQELASSPLAASDRRLWEEERRGAAVLLAGLAEWDGPGLRRAAIGVPGSTAPSVSALLIAAAEIAEDESGSAHED